MGPRGPPAYPQWGSEVERRDAARGALFERRPVAGSECAVQHLPGSTAGQGVQERLGCPSRTARCCPLATEEVDESGEVLLLPLLSEPSSDPEMTETALLLKMWVPLAAGPAAEQKEKQRIYHPALLRGKERCSHHLLKSSPNHLRVARPRASCSWLCRPSWRGPGRAGDPAYDWLHGAAWVEAVAAVRERGQSQGVALGDEQAEVLPAAEWMQQRTAGAGCG